MRLDKFLATCTEQPDGTWENVIVRAAAAAAPAPAP